jgi:hypothetical protein
MGVSRCLAAAGAGDRSALQLVIPGAACAGWRQDLRMRPLPLLLPAKEATNPQKS